MDFDEMARKAKAAAAAKATAAAEKAAAEARERDSRFDRDAQQLLAEVLPIVEKARVAFGPQGVPLVVKDNWRNVEHGRPMRPEITVQAISDERRSKHGGVWRAMSRVARIWSVDQKVSVQVSRNEYGSDSEPVFGKTVEEEVSLALQQVLESYLESEHSGR